MYSYYILKYVMQYVKADFVNGFCNVRFKAANICRGLLQYALTRLHDTFIYYHNPTKMIRHDHVIIQFHIET